MIIHPPESSPYLEPGIDHDDPHSITRLHVDYLGQEEIILITCDDGDVVGYRTEEIQRVIDQQKEVSDDDNVFRVENSVRTFLHRNVGASAWGLAIHREARMIAISANTHKVTVIAYALAQTNETPEYSSASSDPGQEDCSDEEDPSDFPSPRRQDHVITLPARHNVPSVSFNNSGDDPSGRWLTSCSINGETLIWDLHHPDKPVRTIRLGFCASVKDPTKAPQHTPGSCACMRPSNFPHAVWNTMFLDANTAFEDASSRGSPPQSTHPLPYIQDVSRCKNRFTVRSRKIPPPAMVVPPSETMLDDNSSEMDVYEPESSDTDASDAQISSSSDLSGNGDTEANDVPTDAHSSNEALIHASQDTADESMFDGPTPVHNSFADAPIASHLSPPQTVGNAINAFGVWFQPPQNTATIVWDDDGSDTDDELFIPSSTQAHMAFVNAIRPTRAYCEVSTAFTLARQVRQY